jgi:hypothetical protein
MVTTKYRTGAVLIFADFYFCGLKISAPKKKWFVLQEATTEVMLR